jgi:Cu(I)/Ag(I) efflux system membrane fusion protein
MWLNRKLFVRAGVFLVLVVLVGAMIYFWPHEDQQSSLAGGDWTCSMHPQVRLPKPGQCPICGMDLVPAAELSKEKSRIEQRAGILTEPVRPRELFKEVRTVGKLDYNERQSAYITARIAGRVDRVYADFTGIQVNKNVHLADIYSPDLFVAQGELIRALDAQAAARKNPGSFDQSFAETNLEASRTKLRLLGLLPEQMEEIEKSRKTQTHLTIHAPIGGTVIEKNVRAGQYVKEGDVLYRIADLDPIWLYLDLYESDVGWVRFGQQVEVALEAFLGEKFLGRVTFIDPFLDDKTRTVRARVNLPNPLKKLKPAMYAAASIRVRLRADGMPEPTGLEGKYVCPMHPEVVQDKPGRCTICEMPLERVPAAKPETDKGRHEGHQKQAHEEHGLDCPDAPKGKVLAIPASAVLDTGRRRIVYRQNQDGAYDIAELKLGPRAEGKDDSGKPASYFAVLAGLKAGDRVVIRGGFLLDSQRQIEGMPSLLYPEGQGPVNLHGGHGESAPPPPSGSGGHKH